MQTRKLGWTDLELTTVGLGCWAMGGPWKYGWGEQDDNDSIATLHRAVELGINWLDTAPVYGLGRSEEVIGRTLKELPKGLIVATKCGRFVQGHDDRKSLEPKSVRSEAEASLRRLKVDCIDLYQVHWPCEDEAELEDGWGEIARLVRQGKVRYAGLSNFNVAQIRRIMPIHRVASLQPPYSMLRRDVESELLDYCDKNEIGVVAYSPMQKGLLTGKFTVARQRQLASTDMRSFSPEFQEPVLSINLAFVERLRPIAQRHGRTVAQLAIAWVLQRPQVTAAIVGARRPEQIAQTYSAGDWQLDRQTIDEVADLLAAHEKELVRVLADRAVP